MNIKLDLSLQQVEAVLAGVKRSAPGALAASLTAVAAELAKGSPAYTEKQLHKPVPYTQKGFAFAPSNKEALLSSVFVKSNQAKYLKWVEEGGKKTPSPGRKVLPTPPKEQKDDAGNLPYAMRKLMRKAIQEASAKRDPVKSKILAEKARAKAEAYERKKQRELRKKGNEQLSKSSKALKEHMALLIATEGKRRTAAAQKRRSRRGGGNPSSFGHSRETTSGYFVGVPRAGRKEDRPGAPPGLWRREGRRLRLIVDFETSANYKPQYMLEDHWKAEAVKIAPKTVSDALSRIISNSMGTTL